MFVQRVVTPSSRRESWTVIGQDGVPIEPIERYLAYLTDVERSPNTVKAYAHDLKDWFVFLAIRGLDWREVRLEDVGEFVAWLRLPPAGRDGRVVVLPSAQDAQQAWARRRADLQELAGVNDDLTDIERRADELNRRAMALIENRHSRIGAT
jgi:hypothetical protein